MPIYEYQCQACDHQLEALQKISDAPKLDCPACGEPALKKQVSAVAFRLKGSGWYETDFKTGDKKNLAGEQQKKKPSDEKPAAPKKADTKADSKTSSAA
jgi:putative FmdB family regulatory protein